MASGFGRAVGWACIGLCLVMAVGCGGTATTRVVLLPEPGNPNAAVAVGEGTETVILDTPMTMASVDSRGRVVSESVTTAAVEKKFAAALAAEPPEPVSYILYFEEGTTTVLPGSQGRLTALLNDVASRQAVEVQVTGHTDRVGRAEDNDRLSKARAETIRDMLVARGIRASFIRAVGRGEREPLVPTPDNAREPRNRRVEVIIR